MHTFIVRQRVKMVFVTENIVGNSDDMQTVDFFFKIRSQCDF